MNPKPKRTKAVRRKEATMQNIQATNKKLDALCYWVEDELLAVWEAIYQLTPKTKKRSKK